MSRPNYFPWEYKTEMSGPWQTPPAGSELPPRNGNVQRYETRLIQSRNTVTGDQWQVGREVIFNFESDPSSGWLCPSESKLYMRARLKQIADNGDDQIFGFAATASQRLHERYL